MNLLTKVWCMLSKLKYYIILIIIKNRKQTHIQPTAMNLKLNDILNIGFHVCAMGQTVKDVQ